MRDFNDLRAKLKPDEEILWSGSSMTSAAAGTGMFIAVAVVFALVGVIILKAFPAFSIFTFVFAAVVIAATIRAKIKKTYFTDFYILSDRRALVYYGATDEFASLSYDGVKGVSVSKKKNSCTVTIEGAERVITFNNLLCGNSEIERIKGIISGDIRTAPVKPEDFFSDGKTFSGEKAFISAPEDKAPVQQVSDMQSESDRYEAYGNMSGKASYNDVPEYQWTDGVRKALDYVNIRAYSFDGEGDKHVLAFGDYSKKADGQDWKTILVFTVISAAVGCMVLFPLYKDGVSVVFIGAILAVFVLGGFMSSVRVFGNSKCTYVVTENHFVLYAGAGKRRNCWVNLNINSTAEYDEDSRMLWIKGGGTHMNQGTVKQRGKEIWALPLKGISYVEAQRIISAVEEAAGKI